MVYPLLGLGPGGLTRTKTVFSQHLCIPGASHRGDGGKSYQSWKFFHLPEPYNQNNTASLLGGSGGEIITTFI